MVFRTFVTGGHPVVVSADGRLGLGTTAPSSTLDVAQGGIRVRQSASPASSSPCQRGDQRWDENFVYVCVATNTWRRTALTAY